MSTENNQPHVSSEVRTRQLEAPNIRPVQMTGTYKFEGQAPASLFYRLYQPREENLKPSERERLRKELGLMDGHVSLNGRNYQINEPALWRDADGKLQPTIIYDWAMTLLNARESVYGVIMGGDGRPRKAARPMRYGFRLTRFNEFVEGVIWDQDTIITLRCGIVEQTFLPRQVSLIGVNLDDIDVRRDQGYFRLDKHASKSWMLVTNSDDSGMLEETWMPNGSDSAVFKPLHVGSFVRAAKFRAMDWESIERIVKLNYKGKASESIITARLAKAEELVSEWTGTATPKQMFQAKVNPQRTMFWSRVWRKTRSVDLPDVAGFVSNRSLQTIDQGLINVWNELSTFSTRFANAMIEKTPLLDPLAGIDTMAQHYATMIVEVRRHLRMADPLIRI